MSDDFDIDLAERVLMNAQHALAPNRGPERIVQFPDVTKWLGRSIDELKRLRVARVALVSEALNELNGLMLTQLDDALRRRGSLVEAVKEFRERNYRLDRQEGGAWRWVPKADSDIHAAIEKLTRAMLDAERSIQ